MSIKIMSRVWSDAQLSGNDLLCLLALADWADDSGGNIYPSYETISKKLRVTRRTAIRIVARLEAEGYLIKQNGAGNHRQNTYRIDSDKMTLSVVDSDASDTIDSDASVTLIVTPVSPNTLDIHQNDTSEGDTDDFEEFWKVVPIEIDKSDALKEYVLALEKASHDILLSKMKEYAKLRDGQQQKYTMYPANWLRQERWIAGNEEKKTTASGFSPDVLKFWADKVNGDATIYGGVSKQIQAALLGAGFVTQERLSQRVEA